MTAQVVSRTQDIWDFQQLQETLQDIKTQIEGADADAAADLKKKVRAALEKIVEPDPA